MVWILLAGGRRFFNQVPSNVMIFLMIGGVLYTIGIFFYLGKGYGWHHAAWHFFVLAATVCQYVAALLAV